MAAVQATLRPSHLARAVVVDSWVYTTPATMELIASSAVQPVTYRPALGAEVHLLATANVIPERQRLRLTCREEDILA